MAEVVREEHVVKLVRGGVVVREARIDRQARAGEEIRRTDFSDAYDEGAGDPLELFLDDKEQAYRNEAEGTLVCSFCGKSQREVRKLIAGPRVYICDECITLCSDIIAENP